MSVNTSRARLDGALKELCARWDEAKTLWDDPVSRTFEQRHLAWLEPKVRVAVDAMDKMQKTLAQIRRDCG